MKKTLVPNDFSVPAENAANYALAIAQKLDMNILMSNAFSVRTEDHLRSQLVRSSQDDESGERRACSVTEETYAPHLDYESAEGNISDVVCSLVKGAQVEIIVMGISGAAGPSQLFLGNKTKEMIENITVPLLLVPCEAGFNPIRKIAFATDLNVQDLSSLQFIINLALLLNAQVTIVHITNKGVEPQDNMQRKIDAFFDEVSLSINFSIIKYEYIWNVDVDHGLDWIAEQENYDMIAITHHKHNFLKRIFKESYTQKLSTHIKIPLLVCSPQFMTNLKKKHN